MTFNRTPPPMWQGLFNEAPSQENIHGDFEGRSGGGGEKKRLALIRSGVVLMQVEGGDEREHAAKRQEEGQAGGSLNASC